MKRKQRGKGKKKKRKIVEKKARGVEQGKGKGKIREKGDGRGRKKKGKGKGKGKGKVFTIQYTISVKKIPKSFWLPRAYITTQTSPRVFFPGGTGVPPIRRKFCQSPHPTLVPVFGPRLVPPSRGSSPKI